jgi:hypothetical protein
MNFLNKNEDRAEGSVTNPFAKGGLSRSPPSKSVTSHKAGNISSKPVETNVGVKAKDSMDGPQLVRAVKKRVNMLPRMVALTEQLDAIIEFFSVRSTTNKDLKQSLLLFRGTLTGDS